RGVDAALALRRLDAARYFGRRELRRLTDLAVSLQIDGETMRHAVAFNALAGGLPVDQLQDTLRAELTAAGHDASRPPSLLDLLQQELPPGSGAMWRSRSVSPRSSPT